MNRGFNRGNGPGLLIPPWMGGGDPTKDGQVLTADTSQEGAAKLGTLPASITTVAWPIPVPGHRLVCPVGSTSSITASVVGVKAYPLVFGKAVTVVSLAVEVTTGGSAGSVVDLMIWSDNGSGYPGTCAASGTVTTTTTGVKTLTLNQALASGLYWVGLQSRVAIPTLRSASSITTQGVGVIGLTSATDLFIEPPVVGYVSASAYTAGNSYPAGASTIFGNGGNISHVGVFF